MKIVVLGEFHDINDFSVVYKPGDIIEIDELRASLVVKLGLGREFESGDVVEEEKILVGKVRRKRSRSV